MDKPKLHVETHLDKYNVLIHSHTCGDGTDSNSSQTAAIDIWNGKKGELTANDYVSGRIFFGWEEYRIDSDDYKTAVRIGLGNALQEIREKIRKAEYEVENKSTVVLTYRELDKLARWVWDAFDDTFPAPDPEDTPEAVAFVDHHKDSEITHAEGEDVVIAVPVTSPKPLHRVKSNSRG